MKQYYPDFDRFLELAEQGNTVPVYRNLLADGLTPVGAYQRLTQRADGTTAERAFLLESVVGGEQIARYSFVAVDPVTVFEARREEITITTGQDVQTISTDDPLATLATLIEPYEPVALPNLPGFTGGVVGYASYDMVRYYEAIGEGPEDDRDLPDLSFGLYRTMVVFDHVSKTIKVVSNAHIDGDIEGAYAEAADQIEATIAQLRSGESLGVGEITLDGIEKKPFSSNISREDYCDVVERCKEYIRAGDIFQVVPSQRLCVETEASPFDIYRALRVVNPSPYMFLFKTPELTLVGSSPEILCRVEDRIVTNRPIAGTRPRGKDAAEDNHLEADLLADPKERAEHIMLVDLARNDVGIVAKPGTVELKDLMSVERYSHVMHIVSNVTGELQEGMTAFDALRASLPVGTVSGAPKIRAMQIIDEMERTRRGPYAGAVGYVDFSGNMDMCIALRTMVVSGGKAYVQAGGGVVADSDPEAEYQETINKASALLRAVEIAEVGFDA